MYQSMLVELDRLDSDAVSLGTFDEKTIAATRAFQGNNNLNPFGYVDQDTWAAAARQGLPPLRLLTRSREDSS